MRRHDLTKKDLPTYLPFCQLPLENKFKEQSHRLVTFETFDQSDEETDQKELLKALCGLDFMAGGFFPLENTLKEQ